MHGGLGANNVIFDDIYVLSMPSFSKLAPPARVGTFADGGKHGRKYIRETLDAMVTPAIELVKEK